MFTCKTLIVGLDNINTDAFMWQQFLAEDLRAYGQQLCYLPTLPTEFCAELFQNTTRERMISLQLTCWVTACPLTQSLTLQKTTILYFQRPFLAGWCFLQGEEKKKKRPENILRRNTSICWLFLVRLLHYYAINSWKWSQLKNRFSINWACSLKQKHWAKLIT